MNRLLSNILFHWQIQGCAKKILDQSLDSHIRFLHSGGKYKSFVLPSYITENTAQPGGKYEHENKLLVWRKIFSHLSGQRMICGQYPTLIHKGENLSR